MFSGSYNKGKYQDKTTVWGSRAPSIEPSWLERNRSIKHKAAKGPDAKTILESVVAACGRTQVMALPIKMGPLKTSIAADIGTAVNVLSEKTFLVLKRVSRGSRGSLRTNDLNLVGVSSDSLYILRTVCLLLNTAIIHLDFYVVSNFALRVDGLLGLSSLPSIRMGISPETNMVNFLEKNFRAMEVSTHLAYSWKTQKREQ